MGNETSTTNHVANGYREAIYTRVDADRRYVTLQSFKGQIGGTVKGIEVHFSFNPSVC